MGQKKEPREALFSRAMRSARTKRGVTQVQLAERCGIDFSGITKRESGHQSVSEVGLENTAHGLGITVRRMLLEEIDPELAATAPIPKEESHVISLVVRNVRASLGLSQSALGARVGMVQTSIVRLESGRAWVGEATLEQIAKGLGWTMAKLILTGLTYEAKEDPKASADYVAEVRELYRAAVEQGVVVPAHVAEQIGVARSTMTRFAQGSGGEELAAKIAEAIAEATSEDDGEEGDEAA